MSVIVECECVGDSRNPDNSIKAIRIIQREKEGDVWAWIPNWAIDEDSDVWKKGTSGKLLVNRSIAAEKRLTFQCK